VEEPGGKTRESGHKLGGWSKKRSHGDKVVRGRESNVEAQLYSAAGSWWEIGGLQLVRVVRRTSRREKDEDIVSYKGGPSKKRTAKRQRKTQKKRKIEHVARCTKSPPAQRGAQKGTIVRAGEGAAKKETGGGKELQSSRGRRGNEDDHNRGTIVAGSRVKGL